MSEKNEYRRSIEVWDKVATDYAKKFMDLDLYNESYDDFLRRLPKGTARVLEVGCGPGILTRYFLDKSPGLDVMGIDFSPAMIQCAKRLSPQATFQVMDARNISSLPVGFEGIAAGFILPYLSEVDRENFLVNCSKLLSPGGVLYLSYVPGPAERSGYLEGSTGDRLFFHYLETPALTNNLNDRGFDLLQTFVFNYSRSEEEAETHCALIAQKR